jgi:teichuronic acid biosynthesis glycosyltransferase TuaH
MGHTYIHLIINSSSWLHPKVRYRRHRLAEYLMKQEDTDDVIWAYPSGATPRHPGSYLRLSKLVMSNPSILDSGIKEWVLPDYIPGRLMKYKSGFGSRSFKQLKQMVTDSEAKKVLWYTYPVFPYIAKILDWDMIVYDCSDLWTEPSGRTGKKSFSSIISSRSVNRAETEIIMSSGIVFASSDYLAERVEIKTGCRAVAVENGVDASFFRGASSRRGNMLNNVPGPRFGYIGALRPKNDLALLDNLAREKPEWSVVLVGPDGLSDKEDLQKLLQKKNVYWVGAVEQALIPDYISSLDVGLLPYREIEYNKAVFPIKFYEYLSQGIPAVASGIPSTGKYNHDGVYIHGKREDFTEACQKALSWSGNSDYTRVRVEMAEKATWESKLSEMLREVRGSLT